MPFFSLNCFWIVGQDAGVLAAGLLEMADPSLSSNHFFRQNWMDESEGSTDSILKHKPIWSSYNMKHSKKKRKNVKKQGRYSNNFWNKSSSCFRAIIG